MSTHDEFWRRVNELLDARLDPLEDAQVQRELERRPELLDELQTLRGALDELGASRLQLRTLTRPVAGPVTKLLVAAAAAAALVVWIARRDAPAPSDMDTQVAAQLAAARAAPPALAPRFAPIPPAALLELRATITLTSPSGERIEHIDFVALRSSVERRELGPQGQPTLLALAHHQPRVRQP